MTTVFKRCRGAKKICERKIDRLRKKLVIPESEISKWQNTKSSQRQEACLWMKKILEEYFVKIYEIDLYIYEHYKEKIQVNINRHEYILIRIDIYFSEYLLAVEIDEKGHTDRDFIFEEKRQKALEKNLVVNLSELIQASVIMKIMKLAEYEHLLVSLKTYN